ncbi:MAG: hypothetical protein IJM56_07260 [Clostridia bacterium]|nr:hypothetical protein [Clostridia bacterium]
MNSSKLLERSGMFLLVLMPFYSFVTQFLVNNPILCFAALIAVTLVGGFVSALPKHVGAYSETEVIRYEGGINRGDDPNPDRESRHEIIKEGRRFPLRLPVGIAALALSLVLLLLVPASAFRPGNGIYRFGFIALTLVFEAGCMASLAAEFCFWTELPGIAIGFTGYLLAALYMHFSKATSAAYNTGLGVFALIFLFGAFVCLNRASLSNQSGESDRRGVPKALEKRNRRVVLIFAAIIALISFVKPVRDAALWVLRWVVVFFKWLGWLLRGGKDVDKGDLNRILAMQGFGEEMEIPPEQIEEIEEELEQIKSTVWDKVFVFIFLGLLVLGVLFIIYSYAVKQQGKKPFWRKKRKRIAGEGYYDEKEAIEGDEIRQKYSRSLRDRLKNLFNRETPWEKLSPREKARRLLKQLYRKKQSGISGLRSLTAKEALEQMQLKPETAEKTAEAYDTARYSEHELKDEEMDALRKELKL